jgi:hypothetical protein
MISIKVGAAIAAAFIAGAFIASPELRAYAANTVGSSDIINESILSADIKNGEVKAADIATDAVGAAELQGVTKLLFGQCVLTSEESARTVGGTGTMTVDCTISGIDSDDYAMATLKTGNNCFGVVRATPTDTGDVLVVLQNGCDFSGSVGTGSIAVLVYDK